MSFGFGYSAGGRLRQDELPIQFDLGHKYDAGALSVNFRYKLAMGVDIMLLHYDAMAICFRW